jgi:catechol 2,3-dioxygenase-like lactoylglutathione lyase family enzyme
MFLHHVTLFDLGAVLPRLEAAGGTDVRRATLRNGHGVATLRDPDGILVELLDVSPSLVAAS